jgi:hypothetical protein
LDELHKSNVWVVWIESRSHGIVHRCCCGTCSLSTVSCSLLHRPFSPPKRHWCYIFLRSRENPRSIFCLLGGEEGFRAPLP